MDEMNIDSIIAAMKYSPESFFKDITYTKDQSETINCLIDQIIMDEFSTTKEKGDSLERLIDHIFVTHKLFQVHKNIYTSTNEIDLLLKLTLYGSNINRNLCNSLISGNIITECKNYKDPVGVTWVGKFASLLDVSKLDLGLLIAKNGITGKHNWDAAKGLIRKISLKRGTIILDFKLSDFRDMEGKNIMNLIAAKIDYLNLDMKFELEPHPAEHIFKV